MRSRTEKAEVLLRVDHQAALDKLVRSQLQGVWQLPAELARLAIFSGARSLAFNLGSSRLEMVAWGAQLNRQVLADFATVLDCEVEVGERHRAMVALEDHDAFALAALAGVPSQILRLRTAEDDGLRLERVGVEVQVSGTLVEDFAGADLFVSLEGIRLDVKRATQGLKRMGRFSPVPLSVGGAAISRGFEAPLIKTRLRATATPENGEERPSLPVRLAIPRRGQTPRLWLLRHGVITTRATVPGFPAFEAAVEMSGVAPPGPQSTGAALREAIGPYLEHLVDSSIRLNLRLAESAAAMPEKVRARTARRLLEAAHKRRRPSQVAAVKIFPLLTQVGSVRLVSLDEISRMGRVEHGGPCALDAFAPHQDIREFVISEPGVLRLSDGERALLGERLKVVFSVPPTRLRPSLIRRVADGISERLNGLPIAGGIVEESGLTTAEQDFLTRLRVSLATSEGTPQAVAFRLRGGRVRCNAKILLLPRDHPTVRACVQAVGENPAWMYPALVYLLAGHGRPGKELRQRWLAAQGQPPRSGEELGLV
jgi:hypothetical protein